MDICVYSPHGEVFKGTAKSVNVPGYDGSLGILDNHAPLLARLTKGQLLIEGEDQKKNIPIISGVIEVCKNRVTILCDTE